MGSESRIHAFFRAFGGVESGTEAMEVCQRFITDKNDLDIFIGYTNSKVGKGIFNTETYYAFLGLLHIHCKGSDAMKCRLAQHCPNLMKLDAKLKSSKSEDLLNDPIKKLHWLLIKILKNYSRYCKCIYFTPINHAETPFLLDLIQENAVHYLTVVDACIGYLKSVADYFNMIVVDHIDQFKSNETQASLKKRPEMLPMAYLVHPAHLLLINGLNTAQFYSVANVVVSNELQKSKDNLPGAVKNFVFFAKNLTAMKRFAQKFSIDIFYDPNFQFYNLHDLSALQEIKYRVHKSQPVRTLDCKMPLDLLRQPSSPEGSTNDSKDSSKSKSKTGGIITPVVQTEEKDLEEEKSNAEESFSENSVDEPCDMVGLEFEKIGKIDDIRQIDSRMETMRSNNFPTMSDLRSERKKWRLQPDDQQEDLSDEISDDLQDTSSGDYEFGNMNYRNELLKKADGNKTPEKEEEHVDMKVGQEERLPGDDDDDDSDIRPSSDPESGEESESYPAMKTNDDPHGKVKETEPKEETKKLKPHTESEDKKSSKIEPKENMKEDEHQVEDTDDKPSSDPESEDYKSVKIEPKGDTKEGDHQLGDTDDKPSSDPESEEESEDKKSNKIEPKGDTKEDEHQLEDTDDKPSSDPESEDYKSVKIEPKGDTKEGDHQLGDTDDKPSSDPESEEESEDYKSNKIEPKEDTKEDEEQSGDNEDKTLSDPESEEEAANTNKSKYESIRAVDGTVKKSTKEGAKLLEIAEKMKGKDSRVTIMMRDLKKSSDNEM